MLLRFSFCSFVDFARLVVRVWVVEMLYPSDRPSFLSPLTPYLQICACTTTTLTAPTTTTIYEYRYNERYFVGWKVLVEITVVTAAVVGISAYSVIVAQRTI
jgi:hypothetical protein